MARTTFGKKKEKNEVFFWLSNANVLVSSCKQAKFFEN